MIDTEVKTLGPNGAIPVDQQSEAEEYDTGWERLKPHDFDAQINKDHITCVVFGGKTCRPCGQMKATMNTVTGDYTDIEYFEFDVNAVNEATKEINTRYGVENEMPFPRTIFFKSGEILCNLFNQKSVEEIRYYIDLVTSGKTLVLDPEDIITINKLSREWRGAFGISKTSGIKKVIQEFILPEIIKANESDLDSLDNDDIEGYDKIAHDYFVGPYWDFFNSFCAMRVDGKQSTDLELEDIKDFHEHLLSHPKYVETLTSEDFFLDDEDAEEELSKQMEVAQ